LQAAVLMLVTPYLGLCRHDSIREQHRIGSASDSSINCGQITAVLHFHRNLENVPISSQADAYPFVILTVMLPHQRRFTSRRERQHSPFAKRPKRGRKLACVNALPCSSGDICGYGPSLLPSEYWLLLKRHFTKVPLDIPLCALELDAV